MVVPRDHERQALQLVVPHLAAHLCGLGIDLVRVVRQPLGLGLLPQPREPLLDLGLYKMLDHLHIREEEHGLAQLPRLHFLLHALVVVHALLLGGRDGPGLGGRGGLFRCGVLALGPGENGVAGHHGLHHVAAVVDEHVDTVLVVLVLHHIELLRGGGGAGLGGGGAGRGALLQLAVEDGGLAVLERVHVDLQDRVPVDHHETARAIAAAPEEEKGTDCGGCE